MPRNDFEKLALGASGQPAVRVMADRPGTVGDFFGDQDAMALVLGGTDLMGSDSQGELIRAVAGLVQGDLDRFRPGPPPGADGEDREDDEESGDREYLYPWSGRRRRLKVVALPDNAPIATLRVKGDQLARTLRKHVRKLGVILPSRILADDDATGAFVEGLLYGNFAWTKYKSRERCRGLEEIHLFCAPAPSAKMGRVLTRAQAIAEAACLAKGLTFEPPDRLNPRTLAAEAERRAQGLKRIRFERWSEEKIKRERLAGLLAVGRGSAHPVTQIEWTYEPAEKPERTIVVVGKGITYDCGGLQDKGSMMSQMNRDMAGAAAVVALMGLVDHLAPRAKVIGLAGAAENMDGPHAYKTDEIITHRDGRTTLVGHTDAEGRIILYDQLVYAREIHQPDLVIDAATLTGAVKIALGPDTIGVMSNKKGVEDRKRLLEAARRAGEKAWVLPLSHDLPNAEFLAADYEKNFNEVMLSKIADLNNDGDQKFGAGTAKGGGYLAYAIDEKVPWIHLDIAYTAMDGPVGSPVPTLAYLLTHGGT